MIAVLAQLYCGEAGSQELIDAELAKVRSELCAWLGYISQQDESSGPCRVWFGLVPSGGWKNLSPSEAMLRLATMTEP
eukprot:m.104763 g.104763  ORF g.104763 m.104763 type:complete len:78 (+) comp15260_c0_seq2:72-305(+)